MQNLFEDLTLSSIGNPLSNGSFYFEKGSVKNFHYKNLSSGEKAAFDIILDLIIKSEYYSDSIYCIDEPETHIHTKLQSVLLNEMFNLIPNDSQLWLATHSLGMMRKAKELNEANPGSVVFLDFDNKDFDVPVILKPASIDKSAWDKFLSLAIDEYATYLTPEKIVFCEGDSKGKRNKDFDARCYSKIFENEFSEVAFYSLGSCNNVEDDKNKVIEAVKAFAPKSTIIRLVDRDDRSQQEIEELKLKSIHVLSVRHLEAHLLDDEIIKKLCEVSHQSEKFNDAIKIKQDAICRSIQRGNAVDDVKSAAGDFSVEIKKLLSLTRCGNDTYTFLRDTICPLVTPDTEVYKRIKIDIFGS